MVNKVNEGDYWSNGYTAVSYQKVNDSHFRVPFHLTKDAIVYLSSHRGHAEARSKQDAFQVDIGVYLDSTWKSSLTTPTSEVFTSKGMELPQKVAKAWAPYNAPLVKGVYLPWRDMSAATMTQLKATTDWINEMVDDGLKVEIACIGGHGRTGTLAAALLLSRHPTLTAPEAMEFLRALYCKQAVETISQEDALYRFTGAEPPVVVKAPAKVWTPPVKNKQDKKNTTGTNADILRSYFFRDPVKRLVMNWTEQSTMRRATAIQAPSWFNKEIAKQLYIPSTI